MKTEGKVIKVGELLSKESLSIPNYQRPYKWTKQHVQQLFADIDTFKGKPSYRLGTIVLHKKTTTESETCEIVDGQQRIVTLLLIVHALKNSEAYSEQDHPLKNNKTLGQLSDNLSEKLEFGSDISQVNIHKNYQEASHLIKAYSFSEEHVEFLLQHCEVVIFSLEKLSEAFQFFDSQNARGRELEPHDLLKAYHLREFHSVTDVKRKTVAAWEEIETDKLTETFSKYLYRIRAWGRGQSARYFSKHHIELFKGVNLETASTYPYLKQIRMADCFTNAYNAHYMRQVDGIHEDFPFRLDQSIINGRRFFEMITYYHSIVESVTTTKEQQVAEDDTDLAKIYKVIKSYEGHHRTGDRYVRRLFDCLVIYYQDKFGDAERYRAIRKIFIWSYRLRLTKTRVSVASMDNYVRTKDNNLFELLKNAYQPSELINHEIPALDEVRCTKTTAIEDLFKELNALNR